MTTMEMLKQIFELCIVPLLGILTAYLVQIIKVKSNEIAVNADSEIAKKYIDMLTKTVTDCVIATNQTYVNSLKEKGEFTKEAQKIAFQKTYNQIMMTLNNDAYQFLQTVYSDLDGYIKTMIEAEVNNERTWFSVVKTAEVPIEEFKEE